jgi:magnesium chelatase family protein
MNSRFTKVFSAALQGVEATEVEIEVNEGGGNAILQIVGLPDAAVRESRDRVLTAIRNVGYKPPKGYCTVNLAPADLKKEGAGFDLPIALGIIAAGQELEQEKFKKFAITGELALDGAVRTVRGVLPFALEARRRGREAIIVPKGNAAEASVVEGIIVYGVETLRQAYELVEEFSSLKPEPRRRINDFYRPQRHEIDFADVKGQSGVKRAIEVAVAGGHNLLMIGPPGTGKSMIAQRIATIMPPMSEAEAIDATKIHSISGLLSDETSFLAARPFRSPHHTISDAGLLGGSSHPMPGEVSLAHQGVLFLDELPEFRRSTLEVMRQPLEDGKVTISRAAATVTYPARFMLVAAMNPCPCGYFGDLKRECRCHPNQVRQYRQRISGPLLDRIDIHIEVPLVDFKELTSAQVGDSSAVIRERVEKARTRQRERFGSTAAACNSMMTPRLLKEHAVLDEESRTMLEQVMMEMNFSARAHDRIVKVARTLADLDGAEKITADHLLEAIQYRTLDRQLW